MVRKTKPKKGLRRVELKKGKICLEEKILDSDAFDILGLRTLKVYSIDHNETLLDEEHSIAVQGALRGANAYLIGEVMTDSKEYGPEGWCGRAFNIYWYYSILYLKIKKK